MRVRIKLVSHMGGSKRNFSDVCAKGKRTHIRNCLGNGDEDFKGSKT